MNRNLRRVAASLLFTLAAVICFLGVSASSRGQETGPNGTVTYCSGLPGAQIAYPFSDHYSCASLGPVPGLPSSYGGLTFKYDDPNTVLIGGGANDDLIGGHNVPGAIRRRPVASRATRPRRVATPRECGKA